MTLQIDIQDIVSINELLNDKQHTVIDANRQHDILSSYMYYSTIKQQICSVFKQTIKNHAFIDANKRTALLTLIMLANQYNLHIVISDDEMFILIQQIAITDYAIDDIVSKIF